MDDTDWEAPIRTPEVLTSDPEVFTSEAEVSFNDASMACAVPRIDTSEAVASATWPRIGVVLVFRQVGIDAVFGDRRTIATEDDFSRHQTPV